MKALSKYFVLLMVVSLSGCLTNMPANQTPVSVSTAKPTDLTPRMSATSAQSASQCFGVQTKVPENVNGNFVLSGDYWLSPDPTGVELHSSPSYIVMSKSKARKELPKEITDGRIQSLSVSPNKKMLAYYTQGTNAANGTDVPDLKYDHLTIVSNNGDKIKEYYNQNLSWYKLIGWFDDNHLLISKFTGTHVPFPVIVLDPFSDAQEEIMPNYPEIYSGGYPWVWSWEEYASVETVYNSDRSLVVYPKTPSKFMLWDIKSEKIIKQIDAPGASNLPPLWLSNGKQFITNIAIDDNKNYPPKEELVSINVYGEVKRLTHLLDLYEFVEIGRYSESADGHYIAFWFRHNAAFWFYDTPATISDVFQLAVYNTITEQTKIYCVETLPYIQPPIWSPIENHLLVAGFLDNAENYGAVFVDVEADDLSYVEKEVIPVGWMLSDP